MSIDAVDGASYGPFTVSVSDSAVGDLVAATGDDPARWSAHAPPAFANTALFSAAPAFLDDPRVVPFTRSLIHTEQVYSWSRPLGVGETLQVSGTVTGLRARGPLNIVTFTVEATGDAGPWLEGTSGFLLSDQAAAAAEDEGEPPALERADNTPNTAATLPDVGADVPSMVRSASRADLVRYAGATRDWNPIHWDHDAARGAGLGGVIVHGLLMGAWLAQAAARHGDGPHPLSYLRLRFRQPLRPGRRAEIGGTVDAVTDDHAELKMRIYEGDTNLVVATARVTR